MRSACRGKICLLLATTLAVVAGCALFRPTGEILSRSAEKPQSDRKLLAPIQASRDAMQIEIVFAERPLGDRLLGTALWQEIDQVGAVSADTRKTLAEYGLRVGSAGSSLPPALERLLELTAKSAEGAENDESRRMSTRRIYLLSGAEDLIPTSRFSSRTVTVPTPEGMTAKEYKDATGVLRLTAHRVQDGWARLEFQPEIHHGPSTMRRFASKDGWASTFSQSIDPFYNCRFSVNLHVGEMTVITADGTDLQSLGSCCFITGDDDSHKVQRVLVVRLMNMAKTDAVYGK